MYNVAIELDSLKRLAVNLQFLQYNTDLVHIKMMVFARTGPGAAVDLLSTTDVAGLTVCSSCGVGGTTREVLPAFLLHSFHSPETPNTYTGQGQRKYL